MTFAHRRTELEPVMAVDHRPGILQTVHKTIANATQADLRVRVNVGASARSFAGSLLLSFRSEDPSAGNGVRRDAVGFFLDFSF